MQFFGLLRLLLDLDTYGGVDPFGVFLLFLKKVADIIAPKLSIIFRWLIRLRSFLQCLRSANVAATSKGAPSPDRENFRPISITPILSKVYEKLVSHKLSCFCLKYGLLSAAQFAYWKGLGCTDALLTISHHLQKSSDAGMESYIVQLDFGAALDRVSHSGLLFKLKSIGVGGSVLSICTEFLSDRRQRVVADGAAREWIPMISGVPQGSVFCHLLFILYTSEMFDLVENRLFAYAYDSTLLAVVHKPEDRPGVASSLNRDVARIQEWGMILNRNKTKALVRFRTVSAPHGDFVLSGVSILASPNLDVPGVKLDSKAHLRRPCALYCFPCLSENWYFEVGETHIFRHL